MFVCVVAIGTFVMAPAELGEPARICVTLHWGADLAQREGGGGNRLRLERQQLQHERQERTIQREWKERGRHLPVNSENINHRPQTSKRCCCKEKQEAYIKQAPVQICFPHISRVYMHRNTFIHQAGDIKNLLYHPSFPVLFTGNEVRAGWKTKRDAVAPGNGQPPVSGEPSSQTDCGGESVTLFS